MIEFFVPQLEKRFQNDEDTLQVINMWISDRWFSRLHKGQVSLFVMPARNKLDWVGKILYNTIQYNTIQYNTIQYNTLFFTFPLRLYQYTYEHLVTLEFQRY